MARIKEWEELTIQDNFLFQKVMQNKRLCIWLITKLLGIKVKDIIYPCHLHLHIRSLFRQ